MIATPMQEPSSQPPRQTRKGLIVPMVCVGIVAGMVGLAYAAVPLYRLFCQITGYGGTTQTAEAASDVILERMINVRFDANTNGLKWDFKPEEIEVSLKVGENKLAYYSATNISPVTTTGTSTFNVTPLEAGAYFNKIECFCFTEQVLAAGETIRMPVSFFIDPAIADDPELNNIKTITLSYTFFPVKTAPEEVKEEDQDQAMIAPGAPAVGLN
ncbi:Cytochrome oxidase biogenesis protein Cox11-CtaG, copper delivery to Cox1 [hydrothermal vent metagenome]|uniref:Cytochrome oxidase biogenesis protein Cox11-CtaG, copper delivery to Cox1 n=1 Tax=hydrothermal vent metagenome TaxID=652676 RepID=A0A3B0TE49_9ZZZZ